MNWKALSFDWNHLRAFLVTAETGSFSAAARELGLTQPTLGRQVAALEAELGLTLFERVGRSLSLTEAGRAVHGPLRDMGDAAMRVSLAASGQVDAVSGRVSLSVAGGFAAYVMPDLVARLAEVAPQIELEIVVSDELSDLQRREADIAVRHVRPQAPDLIARRLPDQPAWLYASRSWVARHQPKEPADIAAADYLTTGTAEQLAPYLEMMGVPDPRPRVRANCGDTVLCWELARRGLGICPMMEHVAQEFPEMVIAAPGLAVFPVPYWLCVHRELHTNRRIRVVFDFLADALSQRFREADYRG